MTRGLSKGSSSKVKRMRRQRYKRIAAILRHDSRELQQELANHLRHFQALELMRAVGTPAADADIDRYNRKTTELDRRVTEFNETLQLLQARQKELQTI